MTTNPHTLRDILRETADLVLAEPRLVERAALAGTFREVTTDLRAELVGHIGYDCRAERLLLIDTAHLLRVDRRTLADRIEEYRTLHGLEPTPLGRSKVDMSQVVRLTPTER